MRVARLAIRHPKPIPKQLLQLWRSSVLAKHRSFDHEHTGASMGSLPEGMQKSLHLLLTPLRRQVSWGDARYPGDKISSSVALCWSVCIISGVKGTFPANS
jgi:hypothetical protein